MKRKFLVFMTVVLSIFVTIPVSAQNQQQQKTPAPEELAAQEADRLAELLNLEGWQVFYVDSTLQHDFAGMTEELKSLQTSKVENYSLYQAIQDKWLDRIDESYKKFFTKEQWDKYLKKGAAKNQKARAKRRAKAGMANK